MNLVDSSGWLEYFADSPNADNFATPIENTSDLLVSTINLYEVFKIIYKQRDEASALQAIAFMQQGQVVDVDQKISLLAAKQHVEKNIPMADSLIYATAQIYNATIWTQDNDFRNLKNVKYFVKK